MATGVVTHPIYLAHETGIHPERPARLQAIQDALARRRSLEGVIGLDPRPAARDQLLRTHSEAMVDRVEAACRQHEAALDADTAICERSYEAALWAVGGTLAAVDAVMERRAANALVLARPPGHHATPTHAMGFCLFNQVAVAARYAQDRFGVSSVLIIDWDVHHGNGTQDIFYDDPSVFYLSLHQHPAYPGTGAGTETGTGRGAGTTLNVPLRRYTPAPAYLEAFRAALQQVTRHFSPELVLISAGFDAHARDPLGGLLLHDEDFQELTLEVLSLADRFAGGRVVSVLEGGYNLTTLGDTVATHLETLKQG